MYDKATFVILHAMKKLGSGSLCLPLAIDQGGRGIFLCRDLCLYMV